MAKAKTPEFKPVDLVKGDRKVTATTAVEEVQYRYDGFSDAPKATAKSAK